MPLQNARGHLLQRALCSEDTHPAWLPWSLFAPIFTGPIYSRRGPSAVDALNRIKGRQRVHLAALQPPRPKYFRRTPRYHNSGEPRRSWIVRPGTWTRAVSVERARKETDARTTCSIAIERKQRACACSSRTAEGGETLAKGGRGLRAYWGDAHGPLDLPPPTRVIFSW